MWPSSISSRQAPDSPWIMALSHFLEMHKDDMANLKEHLVSENRHGRCRETLASSTCGACSVEVDVQVSYDMQLRGWDDHRPSGSELTSHCRRSRLDLTGHDRQRRIMRYQAG